MDWTPNAMSLEEITDEKKTDDEVDEPELMDLD
jgi:hypothetical protein